jgi:hypothetical protein
LFECDRLQEAVEVLSSSKHWISFQPK